MTQTMYEPTAKEWARALAYNYVNACGSNQIQAYMKTKEEFGMPVSHAEANSMAYKQFKKSAVIKYIQEFRDENFKKLEQMREDNIAMLMDIAQSSKSPKDRIAAIKELNLMCGFNQQNIKVDSDKLEIVIE